MPLVLEDLPHQRKYFYCLQVAQAAIIKITSTVSGLSKSPLGLRYACYKAPITIDLFIRTRCIFTVRNSSCGTVMLLHLSVILPLGPGGRHHPGQRPPWQTPPLGRPPQADPRQTPPPRDDHCSGW